MGAITKLMKGLDPEQPLPGVTGHSHVASSAKGASAILSGSVAFFRFPGWLRGRSNPGLRCWDAFGITETRQNKAKQGETRQLPRSGKPHEANPGERGGPTHRAKQGETRETRGNKGNKGKQGNYRGAESLAKASPKQTSFERCHKRRRFDGLNVPSMSRDSRPRDVRRAHVESAAEGQRVQKVSPSQILFCEFCAFLRHPSGYGTRSNKV